MHRRSNAYMQADTVGQHAQTCSTREYLVKHSLKAHCKWQRQMRVGLDSDSTTIAMLKSPVVQQLRKSSKHAVLLVHLSTIRRISLALAGQT